MMRLKGMKQFKRTVNTEDPDGYLGVQIGIEANMFEIEAESTDKEREDLLKRAESACREACNWLKEQLYSSEKDGAE